MNKRISTKNQETGTYKRSLWRRRGAGSVVVEFALVAPILIILVMGIVQYGIIARTTSTLTNLSRVGARFGARSSGITDDQIRAHIKDAAASTAVDYNDLTITITPTERVQGDALSVEISYSLNKKVFLPGTQYIVTAIQSPGQPAGTYVATGIMRVEVQAGSGT